MLLFTELPRETVRKGVRGASEASILVAPSNEIELLGPVSSVFEASVRSLSGLFGQSLRRNSRKPNLCHYSFLEALYIGAILCAADWGRARMHKQLSGVRGSRKPAQPRSYWPRIVRCYPHPIGPATSAIHPASESFDSRKPGSRH